MRACGDVVGNPARRKRGKKARVLVWSFDVNVGSRGHPEKRVDEEEFVDGEMSVVRVDCVAQELDVVSKEIECSKVRRER